MTDHTDPHSHTPSGSGWYWHWLALVLLVLLGGIQRWYGIDRESLWSDELFAVMASYAPTFQDIWPLLASDSHPPGYVSFMYWTIPWTGYSDMGIRLHAFVFGILWIPLVYWIGHRWMSPTTGLIAAALITSSQCAIFYSQEARVYSMLVAFCLVNILCFLEVLLTKPCQRRYIAGFIISSIITLYLHYTGFVLLATQGLLYLLMWISGKRHGAITELLLLFAVPLATFGPWLTLMVSHMSDTTRVWAVSAPPTWQDLHYTFQSLFGPNTTATLINNYSLLTTTYAWSLLAASLLALRDCFTQQHSFSRKCLPVILLLLAVVPVAAYFIYSHVGIPIFQYRYMLPSLPLGILLCAHFYERVLITPLPPRWRVVVFPVLLLALPSAFIWHNFHYELYSQKSRDPARDAAQWIQQDVQKNGGRDDYTVIMTHDWFEHYLRQYHLTFDPNKELHIIYASHQLVVMDEHLEKSPEKKYLYYVGLENPQTEAVIFGLKIRYHLMDKTIINSRFGGIVISKFNMHELPAAMNKEDEESESGEGRLNNVAKWVAQKIQGKDPETYTVLMSRRMFKAYLRYNRADYLPTAGENLYYAEHQISEVMDHLKQHPRNKKIIYLAENNSSAAARTMLELHFPLLESETFHTFSSDVDVLIFDNTKPPSTISKKVREQMLQSPLNNVVHTLAKDIRQEDKPYLLLMSHPFFEAYFNFNGLHNDAQWENRFFNHYPHQLEAVKQHLDRQKQISGVYYLSLQDSQTSEAVAALGSLYSIRCQRTFDLSPLGQVAIYAFDRKKPSSSTDVSHIPACTP